jgi:hypothetical protein
VANKASGQKEWLDAFHSDELPPLIHLALNASASVASSNRIRKCPPSRCPIAEPRARSTSHCAHASDCTSASRSGGITTAIIVGFDTGQHIEEPAELLAATLKVRNGWKAEVEIEKFNACRLLLARQGHGGPI